MSKKNHCKFRCTATGDAMITLRLPAEGVYPGFEEVRDFIGLGDFRFGNLETTVHNFESCAGARSGGSWLCSPPGVLDDLRKFGINILNLANNHALDYSYGGLLRTMAYTRERGFPFAGVGENLAAASRPAYLDTPGGRYALIGCTMSLHPEAMAGVQTGSLPGRPGVNGIRTEDRYLVPEEELRHLKRIADMLGLNDIDNIERAEGYLPQLKKGEQPFGKMFFQAAEKAEFRRTIRGDDMKRVTDAVAEARFMADYVAVSFHTHVLEGKSKETVDRVSREFARRCIDAGADAVIGTGPHLLRPLEIYKGKPIFYSLGDFIIQLETLLRAPAEMFANQNLGGDDRLDNLFETRSGHGRRGLCYDPVMFRSVIPYWEADADGLTKMVLMPVEENFGQHRGHGGWPRMDAAGGIIEHLAEMSRPFGVEIAVEKGLGIVKL